MKHSPFKAAWASLLCAIIVAWPAVGRAQLGADSIWRFDDPWRTPLYVAGHTRICLMQLNSISGQAVWAELPDDFAFITATSTVQTAFLSVVSNGFFRELFVTNNVSLSNAIWRTADSSWSIFGEPGTDSLVFSNTSLGIPLMFDQGDQLIRMADQGGGAWRAVSVRTNIWVDSAIITNSLGHQVGTATRYGGALTNITLLAENAPTIVYVNAATNVNLVAIMRYSDTVAWRGTLILTNRTATARTFSLGATTNNFFSLQEFDGITAPFTVTNSQAGRFDYEILGTNVQYSYKPMRLPSN